MVLIDMDRLRKELMAKGDIPIHEVFNTIWEQPIINVSQQEWIPCSKKQPKVEGEYLITMCVEAPMCRTLYKNTIGSWRVEKGWYHETYPGCVAKYYVLAWMPLPEPYKEAKDE